MEKAIRLLIEGRVVPAGAAAAFTVRGDHGSYTVVICDNGVGFCSCPARGACSHIQAASLMQDARVDGVDAAMAKALAA